MTQCTETLTTETTLKAIDFVICLKLFHIISQIVTCRMQTFHGLGLGLGLDFEPRFFPRAKTKTKTLSKGLEIKAKTLTKRTRVLSRTKTLVSRSQD